MNEVVILEKGLRLVSNQALVVGRTKWVNEVVILE